MYGRDLTAPAMFERSQVIRRWNWWITLSALVVAVLGAVVIGQVDNGADRSPVPQPTVAEPMRSYSAPTTSAATHGSTRPLPGVAPDDSVLVGGITNHLAFARSVATTLLGYDAGTDFAAATLTCCGRPHPPHMGTTSTSDSDRNPPADPTLRRPGQATAPKSETLALRGSPAGSGPQDGRERSHPRRPRFPGSSAPPPMPPVAPVEHGPPARSTASGGAAAHSHRNWIAKQRIQLAWPASVPLRLPSLDTPLVCRRATASRMSAFSTRSSSWSPRSWARLR